MERTKIKRKYGLLLPLFFIFGFTNSFAQDHLVPITESIVTYNVKKNREYFEKIYQLLLKDLEMDSPARVIARVSFDPNYVISMESGNILVKRTTKQANLYNASIDTIHVIEKRLKVSPEFRKQLSDLFFYALKETRYHIPEQKYKPDGSRIVFFRADGEIFDFYTKRFEQELVGTTWSPKGEKLQELLAIVKSINEMVETNNPNFQNSIGERCDSLNKRFRNE